MSCLVLTDIAESLMFCEPPTLRYRDIHGQDYVDRYVGISHSLLPLLHDVAELSFQLKMEGGKVEGDSAAPTHFEQVHRALEEKICSWMPEGRVGIGAGKRPFGHDSPSHSRKIRRTQDGSLSSTPASDVSDDDSSFRGPNARLVSSVGNRFNAERQRFEQSQRDAEARFRQEAADRKLAQQLSVLEVVLRTHSDATR